MSLLKSSRLVPLEQRMAPSSFPTVRLTETQEHLTVVLLVPGFDRPDLTISLAKDVLRVSGKMASMAPHNFRAVRRGRRSADFETELKLLSEVAWSDTEAELERGVLTIRLRKDAPATRSLIPIRLT